MMVPHKQDLAQSQPCESRRRPQRPDVANTGKSQRVAKVRGRREASPVSFCVVTVTSVPNDNVHSLNSHPHRCGGPSP